MSKNFGINIDNDKEKSVSRLQACKMKKQNCSEQPCKESKILIPLKITSPNTREHWTATHRRRKKEKMIVRSYLKTILKPKLPVEISIVRIAARRYDDDNMIAGCKTIRDTIADWLLPGMQMGRADDDERLVFTYDQRKGKPHEKAVEISFQPL